jgi:hypothetical protein
MAEQNETTQVWNDKRLALRWFEYEHLPADLQEVSKQFYGLAEQMYELLAPGAERSAGMRKLLEAKDCFVRQAVADRPHTMEE